jgi:hypothetical protein
MFMFVFNENELDILFITIYYHSVLVISSIFNTTVIFFKERDNISGDEIFLNHVQFKRTGQE